MSENLFGLTVAADKGLDDVQCQRLLRENRKYQEVMLQYRCALKALESRLEILNEEFSLQHDRNPIESMKSRLKSPSSIMNKMQKRGLSLDFPTMQANIMDIAGVRVICSFEEDVFFLAKCLKEQSDIEIITEKDYISHPKPNAVNLFMKKYGETARRACPEVPERVHPHQLRHSRAMHLYRAGMPLVLLSEFLGHADVNTTRIYAWADTEMKRQAIQKVSKATAEDSIEPIWANDEEMIKRLYGLA